jgi:hypothetical protein
MRPRNDPKKQPIGEKIRRAQERSLQQRDVEITLPKPPWEKNDDD